MHHKTLLYLMIIAIVIVVTYPYAMEAYNSIQSQPKFQFQDVSIEKIKGEEMCTLNVSGDLKVNYEGELKELKIAVETKGELKTYPNKKAEREEYSVPSTITDPKTNNHFQFTAEIPEECRHLQKTDLKVKEYKKKYF